MLVIVEKKSIIHHLSLITTKEETFFCIHGKGGITDIIPNPFPRNASPLKDIIKNGDIDNCISFETMDYLIAKAILGKKGEVFRIFLSQLIEEHSEVMFVVDIDYMTDVANKLIEILDIKIPVSVMSIFDLSPEGIQESYKNRHYFN